MARLLRNLGPIMSTTGMKINNDKSSFMYNEVDDVTRVQILSLMPYKLGPISVGFKYLFRMSMVVGILRTWSGSACLS